MLARVVCLAGKVHWEPTVTKYLLGAVYGAIAAAGILVSLGATPAEAQMPGGSYLRSCTDVRAFGDRVVATCRRTDGRWRRTAINNVHNCNGGIANANGRLVCGRRHGPMYGFDRRHREFQGYGSSFDQRYNRRLRGDFDYYGR
jgi:hypothetical protein